MYLKWIERFNQLPQAPLIFVLLCLNHFIPLPDANEEMYFGLALQYLQPDWVPGSFSFTESPGTRLLFQYPVGWLLQYISFEWMAILGRVCCYAGFAWLLAGIFRFFGLTNLTVFFLLQILFNRIQAFFGGEWIFQDFETKTITYLFILFSLREMWYQRWQRAVLWAVPGVYFHILVGGWYAVGLFGTMLVSRVSFTLVVRYGLLFAALVAPFFLYLSSEILVGQRTVIDGVNLDWVYTYYRNPHHTVSFHMGWDFFRRHRFDGFLMLLAGMVLGTWAYWRSSSDPKMRLLWHFCMVTWAMLLGAIAISAWDTTGKILKFYPYRIATLGYLFTLVGLFVPAQRWLYQKGKPWLLAIMLLIAVMSIPHVIWKKVRKLDDGGPGYTEALQYIEQNVSPGTLFLSVHGGHRFDFIRRTRADLFVDFKYVPSGGEKLYEWYKRNEAVRKLERDPAYWPAFLEANDISYVISGEPLEVNRLQSIWAGGSYIIYQVQ